MSNQSLQLLLPLPEGLKQWITVNAEFHVLLCHSAGCQQAHSPATISRHLRDKHQVKIKLRKQLDEYLKQWQWPYDFQTVPLPLAGLAPQPVLPVFNGYQCRDCEYKSQSRAAIRQHMSIEHSKKRIKDEEMFSSVRL
jgi:Orsellinic acid/F9775 biosynthesis cluster protein D